MSDDPGSDRLQALPVELRGGDFALVARATVGTAAEAMANADEERLYLSVTLPDGVKIGREVDRSQGLPKDAAAVGAMLSSLPSIAAFLAEDRIQAAAAVETPVRQGLAFARLPDGPNCPPDGGGLRAALFTGTGRAATDRVALDLAGVGAMAVTRTADAPPATVQVTVPRSMPANMAVPRAAMVEIRANAEEWFGVTILTGIAAIDDLLRLRAAGRIEDVASILKGLSPADAVTWFGTNASAAAVLGYGLLRTEAVERLAEPFAGLGRHWPDDPDALVIAAETLARLGRHEEAVEAFLAVGRVGLPAFSFGLNYVVDRLRAYGPRPGGPEFAPERMRALSEALELVQPFALRQDYDMMLTCYSGADPTRPEADPDEG